MKSQKTILLVTAVLVVAVGLVSGAERQMRVSFYGAPDNNPPDSCTIAYPKSNKKCAGGVGTYKDPVTFAARKDGGLPKNTIVYVNYLKKYFINEDQCGSCIKNQIDIWVGGSKSTSKETIACERSLHKESTTVNVNPPSNLPVNTTPLFNTSTRKCYKP